jgi:hypothetical protein
LDPGHKGKDVGLHDADLGLGPLEHGIEVFDRACGRLDAQFNSFGFLPIAGDSTRTDSKFLFATGHQCSFQPLMTGAVAKTTSSTTYAVARLFSWHQLPFKGLKIQAQRASPKD